MTSPRIALLADLHVPLSPSATDGNTMITHELAQALDSVSNELEIFTLDVFAAPGSSGFRSLVSIDIGALARDGTDQSSRQCVTEAAYVQVVLAGLLQSYALVHCVAPLVTTTQLLTTAGTPVVQTVLPDDTDLASRLSSSVVDPALYRAQRVLPVGDDDAVRGLSVDFDRYRLAADMSVPPREIVWSGRGDAGFAVSVAQAGGFRLRSLASAADDVTALSGSAGYLDVERSPSSAGVVWALRALACGVPVVGWSDGSLEALDIGGCAACPPSGGLPTLAMALQDADRSTTAAAARRAAVVGRFSRRAAVGRYRDLYRVLTDHGAPVPA